MLRRFSGSMLENKVGIEAQMVREWKMWNKKGKEKRKWRREEKYETDFSKSMAADGGGRIRTFCSFDNRKILVGGISAFFYVVYMCMSLCRCLYLLKNADEKNQQEKVYE